MLVVAVVEKVTLVVQVVEVKAVAEMVVQVQHKVEQVNLVKQTKAAEAAVEVKLLVVLADQVVVKV